MFDFWIIILHLFLLTRVKDSRFTDYCLKYREITNALTILALKGYLKFIFIFFCKSQGVLLFCPGKLLPVLIQAEVCTFKCIHKFGVKESIINTCNACLASRIFRPN